MAFLAKESVEAWYRLLPEDVASAMEPPGEREAEASEAVLSGIAAVATGRQAVALVEEKADSFVAMGRARRIRFLAWLAARDYPDVVEALDAITGDGTSESGAGGGGAGKVAPYFREDVRALVEALGPRAARGFAIRANLAAVAGAGFEVAGELEMKSGGGI